MLYRSWESVSTEAQQTKSRNLARWLRTSDDDAKKSSGLTQRLSLSIQSFTVRTLPLGISFLAQMSDVPDGNYSCD